MTRWVRIGELEFDMDLVERTLLWPMPSSTYVDEVLLSNTRQDSDTSQCADGWQQAEPPWPTYGQYRQFDGWWREPTDAERESMRGVEVRCATHWADSDRCGAALATCKQINVWPSEGGRHYRPRRSHRV